jgi:hypothetical protein
VVKGSREGKYALLLYNPRPIVPYYVRYKPDLGHSVKLPEHSLVDDAAISYRLMADTPGCYV